MNFKHHLAVVYRQKQSLNRSSAQNNGLVRLHLNNWSLYLQIFNSKLKSHPRMCSLNILKFLEFSKFQKIANFSLDSRSKYVFI